MKKIVLALSLSVLFTSFAIAETIVCSGNTCNIGGKIYPVNAYGFIEEPNLMRSFARDSIYVVLKDDTNVNLKDSLASADRLIIKANLKSIMDDIPEFLFIKESSSETMGK